MTPIVEADYPFEIEALFYDEPTTVDGQVLRYRVHLHWLMKQRSKELLAKGISSTEDPIWNDICKDWADLIELLIPEGL